MWATRGVAAPVGRAAGPRRVEVAHVDGARLHQVAAALGRELALAGTHRDATAGAHLAHGAGVVGPTARFLEPADADVAHPVTQVEGIGEDVALVGVDGDDEVVTGGGAARFDAAGVDRRGLRAELELAPGESHRHPLGDLVVHLPGHVDERSVVPTDDVHREAIAVAAPHLVQRAPEHLADHVPQGGVDAGERHQPDAAIAELVERRRVAELPAALDLHRVLADQAGDDLGAGDIDDLEQRVLLVGGVGGADDALRGVHTRDHGAAVGHRVVAALVDAARGARRGGSARSR